MAQQTKGKTVVFAGNLIADHIKTVAFYPEKNMCAPVLAIETAVGGSVCNTAIDLKVIDPTFTVKAIGLVGNDGDGSFLTDALVRYGVDVSGVSKTDLAGTSCSDVMTEQESGERTFFSYKGAGSYFNEESLPKDLACDYFHLGYLLFLDALDAADETYGTKAAKMLCNLQKKGIKTSVDVLSETGNRYVSVVRPALRYTDYCIINETEGGNVAEISARENGKLSLKNLEAIARKLMSLGVKEKVVIHAPEVGVALDKSGTFTVVPSLTLPKGYVVGTVGAGDAFCAGYIAAHLNGKSDEEALAFASLSAAANLSAKDSVSGMRSAAEIEKLEIFGRRNLC